MKYSCDVGYELNSTENGKVCHSDGQWLPDKNITCQSEFNRNTDILNASLFSNGKELLYVNNICNR